MIINDYLSDKANGIIFYRKIKIIMKQNRIKTLQLLYTGLLVDTVSIYDKHKILGSVVSQKNIENQLAAPARVSQFKLNAPKDVFETHNKLIAYADWQIKVIDNNTFVSSTSCKLCDIAKSINTVEPCRLCCIDPLSSICEALKVPHKIEVVKTLWEEDKCVFKIYSCNNPINHISTNSNKGEKNEKCIS
jgi:hypothetical protein